MTRITRLAVVVAVIFLVLGPVAGDTLALAADAGAIFSPGPQMKQARNGHWSVSLPDGRVALLGGQGAGGIILSSAELWNPATNAFTPKTMQAARMYSACARLNDGRYFLAGGWSGTGNLKHTEIFNPADNSFTDAGNMTQARVDLSAATLTDGRVLIVGNKDVPAGEVYNPTLKNFTATQPLNFPRSNPVVVPTTDGKALVLGGNVERDVSFVEQVERYEPGSNGFTVVQNTLFPGETGWQVLSPTAFGSIPIAHQQLQDGRYLLVAVRQVGTSTSFQARFFTVNPATKEIARLVTTPPLEDYPLQRLPESISPQVIVNKSRNQAYLLVAVAASEIRLYTIDLNTLRLNHPDGSYVLPADYFLVSAGSALLQDGCLFFTGGMDNVNTGNPIKETLFARVPGNCIPTNLLLLK